MQMILDQFKWQVYRAIERLGVLGNAALLLALAAIAVYLFLARPLVAQLAEVVPAAELKSTIAPESNATKLSQFLASLPPVANRASATKTLMDIAADDNLLLAEVTYKTEARPNDAINLYHVEFSLFASYPEVQRFLSVVLNKMSFVSIESLTFERESAQDEIVEARIHLVFNFNQTPNNQANSQP